MYEKERSATLPAAEARIWKSEEGSLAILFVNYVDEALTFKYEIKPSHYGLSADSWQIREIQTGKMRENSPVPLKEPRPFLPEQ